MTKAKLDKTAQDFGVKTDGSKIVADWFDGGIRLIIMVIRGSHFCVYLGIPENHPAAGHSYDDVPIDCHGGLTFGSEGDKDLPRGLYWYGYDYAHLGDVTYYPKELNHQPPRFEDEKEWTLEEVKKDTWDAIYTLKKFMKVAKSIAKPPRQKESG